MSTPSFPPNPPSQGPGPADWLDLYLDDALDDQKRQAFETEMARNPELRRLVELQREIDLSIRSAMVFEPASIRFGDDAAPAPLAKVGRIARPAGRPWAYAIAAALLLSLAGVWSYYMTREEVKHLEPAELYARMELNNFTPEFKCSTDAEFAAAVSRRLGSGLLVSHTPDVELLGWAYGNNYNGQIIGERTLVLMCKVEAKDHVLVLMDTADSDRKLSLPQGSRLHLFRKTLGPLVLYELTPREAETILPKAFIPPIDCGTTVIQPPPGGG